MHAWAIRFVVKGVYGRNAAGDWTNATSGVRLLAEERHREAGPGLEESARRGTGEPAEIANQVGLVVVSGEHGDGRDAGRATGPERPDRAREPRDAVVHLGGRADGLTEPPLQRARGDPARPGDVPEAGRAAVDRSNGLDRQPIGLVSGEAAGSAAPRPGPDAADGVYHRDRPGRTVRLG